MVAVGGPLEPPLLPGPEPVLPHQTGRSASSDGQAAVLQLPRHPRAAVRAVRQREGRPDMRQQHHVLMLAATSRTAFPGKVAALANAKDMAQAVDGELF